MQLFSEATRLGSASDALVSFYLLQIKSCFEECQSEKLDETDRGKLLSKLKLRYFTPREIANLMCFPQDFGKSVLRVSLLIYKHTVP